MENKQPQAPAKSTSKIGQDEFNIETKHPTGRDNEVSGTADKDSGSCSTGCGTKQ